MAINIIENSGRPAYGVKGYAIDTAADVAKLPIKEVAMGSWAFVLQTRQVYFMTSERKWVGEAVNPSDGSTSNFNFKGSVPTFDDLLSDAELGDVYNVEDESQSYVWDGEKWSKTGGGTISPDGITLEEIDGKLGIAGFKNAEEGTSPVKSNGKIVWTKTTTSSNLIVRLGNKGSTVSPDTNNIVTIPTATQTKLGIVKGSSEIDIEKDGSLSITGVNLQKVDQSEGDLLILEYLGNN